MSEKPLFAAPGIAVTRQMATINGQSFAIGQIASVGLRTYRRQWRNNLIIGLLILAPAAYILLFNVGCVNGGCGGPGHPAGLLAGLYLAFGGLVGLCFALIGAIQLLYGAVNPRAGNFLEIGTSDGRIHHIHGLSQRVASSVEAAIMQGIAMR